MIRTENLVKSYRGREVVCKVNVSVSPGEIVGLLGPNGAGKTTTFYMIVGLVKPNSGLIYFDGNNITHKQMYERARMGIGYLPQEASIFRKLSVEENLLAPLEFTSLNKKERIERADSLMEELGIIKIRKSKGYSLSGGERRRVEIARALTIKPKFLLLDEPFAGIDPIAVEDIQQIISDLKTKHIGILITDHNVHETLSITDRSYLIYEGRIFREGNSHALAEDEEAKRLYLGESFTLERYKKGGINTSVEDAVESEKDVSQSNN